MDSTRSFSRASHSTSTWQQVLSCVCLEILSQLLLKSTRAPRVCGVLSRLMSRTAVIPTRADILTLNLLCGNARLVLPASLCITEVTRSNYRSVERLRHRHQDA